MLRLLLIPAALSALVIAAVAWSLGGEGTRADFTFVNRGDHKTLDISVMSWLQDIRVAYALWEGLYALDPQTLAPVPGVAEKIDVDPSQTVYTFRLRETARWSNGDRVASRDFVFAWRRMLEQPAEYTSLHFYIKGAQDYEEAYAAWLKDAGDNPSQTTRAAPDFATVGIRAPDDRGDDRTLIVTLKNPTPFFPALCAFPAFFPLHEPSMRPFAVTDEKTGRVTSYNEAFTRPPNLVTNGPYRLAEWAFKRKLRLVASDYYWNKASVLSRVIDELVIEDALAAFRAYLGGQVDWLSDVDGNLAGEMLQKGGRPDLHVFPGFGTYYYTLNCLPKLPGGRPNPLADARVRQALVMAIDKRPIVDNILRAGQPVATDYIPPGVFPGYPSPAGLPYDVGRARRLLADAGYPGGRGFPPLSILFNKEGQHGDIALNVRSQWQAKLGIEMNTDQVEVKVFGVRLHSRDFDVARSSWIGDYADPTTFTDKFKSDNDDNNAGWKNKAYDDLCAAAETERDPGRRMKILAAAEQVLLNEAAIVPLYHYVNAYMFRENVTGIPLDPRNMVMLQSARVRRSIGRP